MWILTIYCLLACWSLGGAQTLAVSGFSGIRGPVMRDRTYPRYVINVTIENTDGPDYNITPVVFPNTNFYFKVYYDGLRTWPNDHIRPLMIPTFREAELRQGLDGEGASLTLVGEVDLARIADDECQFIQELCIQVDADIVNGASFRTSQSQMPHERRRCVPLQVTCWPDPQPESLTYGGRPIYISLGHRSVTVTDMNFDIVNRNYGQNDVILPATGQDTNYRLSVFFSYVNMDRVQSDVHLGLEEFAGTFQDPSMSKAGLSRGGKLLVRADASMVLFEKDCRKVNFLCIKLLKGSTDAFNDCTGDRLFNDCTGDQNENKITCAYIAPMVTCVNITDAALASLITQMVIAAALGLVLIFLSGFACYLCCRRTPKSGGGNRNPGIESGIRARHEETAFSNSAYADDTQTRTGTD